MQDVNVVVVFYSRTGSTERLALAAAVGAVQGRANIRLRRLPDSAGEATIEAVPAWKENRARMNREFVAPRETDALWADAIVMGTPAGGDTLSTEFKRYFETLEVLREQGKLEGKIGAVFTQGSTSDPLYEAIGGLGLTTVPAITNPDTRDAARLQGRAVADAARSLRTARAAV
jgi:NAD(P)H dehydrogenase (quinone)